MFKLQTPADFYTYLLSNIIDEEFLFNSPYDPSIDKMYANDCSIYESRKMMRDYCISYYRPEYAENQWKFFPFIYQFQDLDESKTEQDDYYFGNIKNDAQLQANLLKGVIHDLMIDDFRKEFRKTKEEILEHYLNENQIKLKEKLVTIEQQFQNTQKVLDFLQTALNEYQSNSPYHNIIVLQQQNLLDVYSEYMQKFACLIQRYMQKYAEEELELFNETLLKYTKTENQTINA